MKLQIIAAPCFVISLQVMQWSVKRQLRPLPASLYWCESSWFHGSQDNCVLPSVRYLSDLPNCCLPFRYAISVLATVTGCEWCALLHCHLMVRQIRKRHRCWSFGSGEEGTWTELASWAPASCDWVINTKVGASNGIEHEVRERWVTGKHLLAF